MPQNKNFKQGGDSETSQTSLLACPYGTCHHPCAQDRPCVIRVTCQGTEAGGRGTNSETNH